MEDQKPEVVVRIIEVAKVEGSEQMTATGRELHVASDFPLFAMLKPAVKENVLIAGQMALTTNEFTPIFNAIRLNNMIAEEADKGEEGPKIMKPYKKQFKAGVVTEQA